jgi:phenylacetic acid degradation operon negative regulatory protein
MKETLKPVMRDWALAVLWGAEQLMMPTWRNLFESYEAWECRRGFQNQLAYLQRRGLARREHHTQDLVYRLTELGRLAALGGRDAEQQWNRDWDRKWRMVLFDLPAGRQALRQKLLRWLRQNGFGYLQNSVWIHPHPLTEVAAALDDYRDDVESLTIMEAQCCAGYSNEAVVTGAWAFDEINKRYAAYLDSFGKVAPKMVAGRAGFERAGRWLRSERVAWEHAFSLDPLLPRALLPRGYLGVKAWQARRRVLSALVSAIGSGRPPD